MDNSNIHNLYHVDGIENFWKDKIKKIWVVILRPRSAKQKVDKKIVRAKTERGALKTAAEHSIIKSVRSSSVRLASPLEICNRN